MTGRRAKQQSGGAPLPSGRGEPKTLADVPSVWDRQQELQGRLAHKTPVVFLDYDGTLTPIVADHTRADPRYKDRVHE